MKFRALMILVFFTADAAAQPVIEIPPDRYGIAANLKFYPQSDPKSALETITKVLETRKYDYLLAHLMDAATVDVRVAERARQIEPAVNIEFQKIRDDQRRNPDRIELRERLPIDPRQFADVVRAEATRRGFKQLVKDVQDHYSEYPEYAKLLRKFSRDGNLNDAGGTVSFSLADVPGRQIFFKRDGRRWFVEDRQIEEAKPAPKAEK